MRNLNVTDEKNTCLQNRINATAKQTPSYRKYCKICKVQYDSGITVLEHRQGRLHENHVTNKISLPFDKDFVHSFESLAVLTFHKHGKSYRNQIRRKFSKNF